MKKILSCIIALCLLFAFSTAALAATDPPGRQINSFSINEYDLLKGLSTKSNLDLFLKGYSAQEIGVIRNVKEEYARHLHEYKYLPEENLRDLGYSAQQIDLIRDFTGSEAEIRAIAATLYFTLYTDYVTWSASQNRTNTRLCYEFEWNGVPLIKTKDIVAVTWNDWTINGKLSTITYVHIYGSQPDQYGSATFVPNDGPNSFGGGFKFAMTRDDNYYWAKSGIGIFTLYHNYERHDLSAYAEYGHSTVTLSPSFSIPGYGSISFSYGVSRAASDHADTECSN